MNVFRQSVVLFATIGAISCSSQNGRGPSTATSPDPVARVGTSENATSGTMASSPLSATVEFGNAGVGSGFPPGSGHDQSAHAPDSLVPTNVVIDAGGTVTFNAVGIHQISIYQPGKAPEDVVTSNQVAMPAGCPPLPPFRIDDPVGRIPINGQNPTGCGNRTYTHTFADPGKYLVICDVAPHFAIKMYGWVTVRDRSK